MINEVITKVLAAETQAENIRNDAESRSRDILTESEKICLNLMSDGEKQAKNRRAEILDEYAKKADAEYEKTMTEAKNGALRLKNEKQALAKNIGESIYGRILNGDC